jgi:hypothetical protein
VARTRNDSGSFGLTPIAAGFATLSLPVGLRLPGGELSIAPLAVGQLQQGLFAGDDASLSLLVGGSLGATIEFTPRLRVLYGATALWVASSRGQFAPFSRPSFVPYGAGSAFAQLSVGIAFAP